MTKNHLDFGSGIAVIGASGRFPGAKNLSEFWDNLQNGIESITFFSKEELILAGLHPELVNRSDYVRAKGILEGSEYFSASFFGYTRNEAEYMDPQIRIFHEVAWEALEDAAYIPENFAGTIGVYAGASSNILWEAASNLSASDNTTRFETSHLCDKDYLHSHLSYKLNLNGPSSSIYSACSTSLTSLYAACVDLLSGVCDLAIVGSVSATLPQKEGYLYQEGMINSPDGHCRAFDKEAKGTVTGYGAGCVVLKRADIAIEDLDNLYAIIKGISVNNDGAQKAGYTAPSVKYQAEVIRSAQKLAKVTPESITYVETHGTGTLIGDPIEIEGLKQAFQTSVKNYCAIGSVKTNIGHLDAAAGIASFLKTILALNNKIIPPSLHFTTPNPEINFEESPFYVNQEKKEWKRVGFPLRAGISSFGIGGTNVHAIVEEAPINQIKDTEKDYNLIVLSAQTESALENMRKNMISFMKMNPSQCLNDIAYTLQIGRKRFEYREMFVCSSTEEAINIMSVSDTRRRQRYYSKSNNRKTVFMFPGQGGQYLNMGKQLYENEMLFRREFDKCADLVYSNLEIDLKKYILNDNIKQKEDIEKTKIIQPLLFCFEYSCARYLIELGVEPYAMIGYSFGEYVAACLSKVISLKDALQLIVYRGNLMEEMPDGAMLSVPLTEKELLPYITGDLSLAVVNGPSCIISGKKEEIDKFEEKMNKNRVICIRVPLSYGSHSSLTKHVVNKYRDALSQVKFNKPAIPYVSSMTGKWVTEDEVTDPEYWIRQMSETVRFAEGIHLLLRNNDNIFLEVGPGQSLSTLVKRQIGEEHGRIFPLIRSETNIISDLYYLYSKIGDLWLSGVKVNWKKLYSDNLPKRISLPTYPFEREKYTEIIDLFLLEKDLNKKISTLKTSGSNIRNPIKDWYYFSTWKYSNHYYALESIKDKREIWLIFKDSEGIGEKMSNELRRYQHHTITVCQKGEQYLEESDYTLDFQCGEDFENLFQKLQVKGNIPSRIIYLGSIYKNTNENNELEQVRYGLKSGFYSILNLIKSINNNNSDKSLQLSIVSNNAQDVTGVETLYPGKATLLGLSRVIIQECMHIKTKLIDIDINSPYSKENLVKSLIQELILEQSATNVAYRSGRRLVEYFEKVSFPELPNQKSAIQNRGVYLITGGLGNIGYKVATSLAEKNQARLIVTGRTNIPPKEEWGKWLDKYGLNHDISKKINQIAKLENFGADVVYQVADAADFEAMKTVVETAIQNFGAINGVFYLAGITEGDSITMLDQLTVKQCEEQFKAKIYGLIVLEKVTASFELDFCAIFSSLASTLGGVGFGAYAAASNFMDTFVRLHNRSNSKNKWISIGWDAWQSNVTIKQRYETTLDDYMMSYEEGIEAMRRIIFANPFTPVIVSTGELEERFNQWVKLDANLTEESGEATFNFNHRSNLLNEYVEPKNEVQIKITKIWESFFKVYPIGIKDNFFDLGGDSLKGITLLSKIYKELGIRLPLSQVFKHPTIEGFFSCFLSMEKEEYQEIDQVEKREYYPVSSAQKRMFLLNQSDKNSVSYNVPDVFLLEGSIDSKRIEQAIEMLIENNEILRTSYLIAEGEIMQVIHENVSVPFEYKIVRGANLDIEIQQFIRPFDLEKAPPIRVCLLKLSEEKHALIFDVHHIATDGITASIMAEEFSKSYRGEILSKNRIQYKDYAVWQDKIMNCKDMNEYPAQAYWLSRLKDGISVLQLETDFKRDNNLPSKGDSVILKLGREETENLRTCTNRWGGTLFMTLLAAYYVLLYKYSGDREIIIGCPVAGRNHPSIEHTMGFFVNTLVMKNCLTPDELFSSFLERVKENTIEAFEHQEFPFEELVSELGDQKTKNRNPVFDVLFTLQNITISQIEMMDVIVSAYPFKRKESMFDISMIAVEQGEDMTLRIEYNTQLFKRETIEQMGNHYKNILRTVSVNLDIPIEDIDLLSGEEMKKDIFYNKISEDDEMYYTQFNL